MRPRIRGSVSPRNVLSANKKWKFGKSSTRCADEESGGSDVGGDSQEKSIEETEMESRGPLQTQQDDNHAVGEAHASKGESAQSNSYESPPPPPPLPRLTDTTNTRHNQSESIDDHLGDCDLIPSTSSNEAVMAIRSTSTTEISPSNNPNPLLSPSFGPRQRQVPSPTFSTSPQYQRSRVDSNAHQTPKDEIDDDAYSAWWFLASISESFDTLSPSKNKTGLERTQQQHFGMQANATNKNSHETHLTNDGRKELKPQSARYLDSADHSEPAGNHSVELPSWNPSGSSSSPKHLSEKSQYLLEALQNGGDYTLKEQRIREKWLNRKKDPSGGTTPNHDQRVVSESVVSVSPYYYVPPQHATIPPNLSSNTDWSITGATRSKSKSKRSADIEWTPQDSSYGAAVPAFGWVPKRMRKLLEGVFVVILLALLIFVVVKTGMQLKSSGSGGGGEIIYFDDDDHYIAFNDDDNRGKDQSTGGSQSNDGSESNDGNDYNDGSNSEDAPERI